MKNGKTTFEKICLVETFNDHCINIFENCVKSSHSRLFHFEVTEDELLTI